MATAKIEEIAKKYHLIPGALKVRAYALFETGLEPADIERQKLLPQLKPSAVYNYYRDWVRLTK